MASELSAAMQRLHLDGDASESMKEEAIDELLFRQARRKQRELDPDALKAELEKKYLSPSTTFSDDWLDRLQQYVPGTATPTVCAAPC